MKYIITKENNNSVSIVAETDNENLAYQYLGFLTGKEMYSHFNISEVKETDDILKEMGLK